MNFVVVILIGIGIGTMVELLMPGHHSSELALAMLLGAAGAVLARFIGEKAGWFGTEEPAAFLAAALGAVIALLVYGAAFRRGHGR